MEVLKVDEKKDQKFDEIYFSSCLVFTIVFAISIAFVAFNFKGVLSFFTLFCLLLKIIIFSIITTIFYTIISLLLFSLNFYFRNKVLYYFYKIKYRNNMNDVNYTYLCKRLEILILNSKISKKKIEKEVSYLSKKNILRKEEIKRNLRILKNEEEIKEIK